MSNRNTAKGPAQPLRIIHGTGPQIDATLEDVQGVLQVMRVARKHNIDLRCKLHAGTTAIDITNVINIDARTAPAAKSLPRFTNLDANCRPVAIGVEHVAVYDSLQDLIFTRAKLPGEANFEESKKKCEAFRLFGRTDWRAQSVQQRVAIADFTKRDPAIDTRHFAKESGWEWTGTVLVNADSSPSGYAWCVDLGNGDALWNGQSARGGVRAVCAGQQLAFRL